MLLLHEGSADHACFRPSTLRDMSEERIDLASGRATLIHEGRRAHGLTFGEIRALHIVSLDHMWLHNDEPFYVLVTDDRVWVLPDDTMGLPALLEAVLPGLFREGKVRQTTAPRIPWRWATGASREGSSAAAPGRGPRGDHPGLGGSDGRSRRDQAHDWSRRDWIGVMA